MWKMITILIKKFQVLLYHVYRDGKLRKIILNGNLENVTDR